MREGNVLSNVCLSAVADPGFPMGAPTSWGGGANSPGSYVSKNLYVKMKESGPVGGVHTSGAPPGSTTGQSVQPWEGDPM